VKLSSAWATALGGLACGAVVLRTVVLRTVVLRTVVLRTVVLRTVVLRTVVLRTVVLRTVVLRTVVLRTVVLRTVVLRTVVLRTVVLRTVVLRTVVLRTVVLRTVVLRTVVLRTVVLRTVVLRTVVLRTVVLRWSGCSLGLGRGPSRIMGGGGGGGGMEVRSRAASLAASGAIALWMAGPTVDCMAAMIDARSSCLLPVGGRVLTLGPKLRVTLGLRLRTAQGPGVSPFLGWGVGEGSSCRWGGGFASRGGLTLCFLGVVGSVLGADPEIVRFLPLSVPLVSPCIAWGGGGKLEAELCCRLEEDVGASLADRVHYFFLPGGSFAGETLRFPATPLLLEACLYPLGFIPFDPGFHFDDPSSYAGFIGSSVDQDLVIEGIHRCRQAVKEC
jgi:hypothetical protein